MLPPLGNHKKGHCFLAANRGSSLPINEWVWVFGSMLLSLSPSVMLVGSISLPLHMFDHNLDSSTMCEISVISYLKHEKSRQQWIELNLVSIIVWALTSWRCELKYVCISWIIFSFHITVSAFEFQWLKQVRKLIELAYSDDQCWLVLNK